MNMKVVLKPQRVPDECFLKEALMWSGFYRFPVSEITTEPLDFRFDPEIQDGYCPIIHEDYGYITSEEAERVGLPPRHCC